MARAPIAARGSAAARESSSGDPVLAELSRGGAERLAARIPPLRRLVANGEFATALTAIDALERELPAPTAVTWGLRGRALSGLGRPEEAASAYERAVALAPDDLCACGGLAETLLRLGRGRESLPHLERYAALTPDSAERAKARRAIDELRAHSASATDSPPGAGSDAPGTDPVLAELARSAPELARGSALHAHLRDALALLDGARYHEARAALDAAIALAPNDARAHALRGRAHRLGGSLDAAFADVEHAIALAPGDALAFVERGLVALARKAYPEAVAAFTDAAARETDPAAQARLREWCDQLRAAMAK